MAYETGFFETTLAAACGADPLLRADLCASYLASLEYHRDLLGRARCDGNWCMAAMRLKGLGASFHDTRLLALAEEALEGAPGDPRVVRQLARHARHLAEALALPR